MIVLDANILVRAVLGRRVRQLLEKSFALRIRLLAPEIAFSDAAKYLPSILKKKGKDDTHLASTLAYLRTVIETVGREVYSAHEKAARRRLRGRDEDDWQVVAIALALGCPIWTEDSDFFGTGIAVWTTDRIEIFLEAQTR